MGFNKKAFRSGYTANVIQKIAEDPPIKSPLSLSAPHGPVWDVVSHPWDNGIAPVWNWLKQEGVDYRATRPEDQLAATAKIGYDRIYKLTGDKAKADEFYIKLMKLGRATMTPSQPGAEPPTLDDALIAMDRATQAQQSALLKDPKTRAMFAVKQQLLGESAPSTSPPNYDSNLGKVVPSAPEMDNTGTELYQGETEAQRQERQAKLDAENAARLAAENKRKQAEYMGTFEGKRKLYQDYLKDPSQFRGKQAQDIFKYINTLNKDPNSEWSDAGSGYGDLKPMDMEARKRAIAMLAEDRANIPQGRNLAKEMLDSGAMYATGPGDTTAADGLKRLERIRNTPRESMNGGWYGPGPERSDRSRAVERARFTPPGATQTTPGVATTGGGVQQKTRPDPRFKWQQDRSDVPVPIHPVAKGTAAKAGGIQRSAPAQPAQQPVPKQATPQQVVPPPTKQPTKPATPPVRYGSLSSIQNSLPDYAAAAGKVFRENLDKNRMRSTR